MPDGAIVIPDTAAAPKDYTLSGAQEIALKSVRALIDGTGAGSAFLPTLQLLDPNGHVMWEGAAQSTVAAGGSADVSWFPVGAQLGGGTATTIPTGFAQFFGAQNVGVGAHNVQFGTFKTNDGTVFSKGAGVNFTDIDIAHGGIIRIDVSMAWSSNTGAPYASSFDLSGNMLDSHSTPIEVLSGPPVDIAEVFSTDVGDFFRLSGTGLYNANDAFYTPPYTTKLVVTVGAAIGYASAAMALSIYNPTAVT
jgi:hypothetical protein